MKSQATGFAELAKRFEDAQKLMNSHTDLVEEMKKSQATLRK